MRLLTIAMLTTVLACTGPLASAEQNKSEDTYRYLNLFGDVFERVRTGYVEEVSDKQLIEAAIDGMLSSLDPHSGYLSPKNFEDMQVRTKGEFGGLGIEVSMENGLVKVISPIDDTPAARAGMQPGDLITHLDGEPILGLTLAKAVEKMRGAPNTDLRLTVRRGDRPPFDVTITRAIVKIRSVRSRLEGDIAYIRITSFNAQAESGLRDAYRKLKNEAEDGQLAGIVLDLRNNPGGLLDQAVAVSDAFLKQGEIVSTRARKRDDAQRFNATSGDMTGGLPIVVLINGGSASASEIVAGALQDHRRAIVLGTQSFGKGSVQTIQPIPGYGGAIRLTNARYHTPSGAAIQAKGVTPDIVVQPARIEEIDVSARRREADLRGALDKDDGGQAPGDAAPNVEDEDSSGEAALLSSEDYQLSRALDLIRGIALYRLRTAVR